MTTRHIAAMFVTMFAIAAVPGPSDFAVVARSSSAGFRHGLLMVAGIVVADALFILIAFYGLTAVAEAHAPFVATKYLGAGYLIWLGVTLWRHNAYASGENLKLRNASSFVSGFLITLGDPKAILFYMGLLPAFLDISRAPFTDAITVMLIATAVICSIKLSYAYMGDRARSFFENTRARKWLDRIAGVVLAGVGVFIFLVAI